MSPLCIVGVRNWYRQLTTRETLVGIAMILGVNLVGALPAVFVSTDTDWFDQPWFYPPEVLFSIVWTLLFTLIAIALFLVWERGTPRPAVNSAVGLFVLQFALNLAWTPVFFGLQSPALGMVVIVALWIAIVATILAFARVSRIAAALLVPYLLWVSYAIAINYAIYT